MSGIHYLKTYNHFPPLHVAFWSGFFFFGFLGCCVIKENSKNHPTWVEIMISGKINSKEYVTTEMWLINFVLDASRLSFPNTWTSAFFFFFLFLSFVGAKSKINERHNQMLCANENVTQTRNFIWNKCPQRGNRH